jgi:hypothetical protein
MIGGIDFGTPSGTYTLADAAASPLLGQHDFGDAELADFEAT